MFSLSGLLFVLFLKWVEKSNVLEHLLLSKSFLFLTERPIFNTKTMDGWMSVKRKRVENRKKNNKPPTNGKKEMVVRERIYSTIDSSNDYRLFCQSEKAYERRNNDDIYCQLCRISFTSTKDIHFFFLWTSLDRY